MIPRHCGVSEAVLQASQGTLEQHRLPLMKVDAQKDFGECLVRQVIDGDRKSSCKSVRRLSSARIDRSRTPI